MMEDLYAKPDLSRKVPAQLQEMEKTTRTADADQDDRNSPIYDNNVTQRRTEDMVEEHQTAASVRVASGTSLKVLLALLCFILLAAVVVMVTLLIQWRSDYSSQQEELWRSLGGMRGDLSQLRSYSHQLMDNYSSLARTVELYKTEMEAITDNLNATLQNLTIKCPDGWKQFQRSCYLQSTSKQNWENSRTFCQGLRADLVVISDTQKQEFIKTFALDIIWIGVTTDNKNTPRIWKGVNGQQITLMFWSRGEPNNSGGNENCVELVKTARDNWNDAVCSLEHFCVCEKIMKA